jgi:ferric-dicitrate binding protein FerR (iron transport regulator)
MEPTKLEIVDLILNESFQRYVLNKNQEDTNYWEEWLTENQGSATVFHEAKSLITFIATRKTLPKHRSVSDEVFEKLLSQIGIEENSEVEVQERRIISPFWYVAATVIVLIGLSFLFDIHNLFNTGSMNSQNLEVIVPKGQRSQVLLPDGTKVWLNAGTIFKYPSSFLKNSREVYLEGEAFFSVSHNKRMPFLVHIKNNLTIKVLGTEFNVKCYNEDRNVETTLIKGSVVFTQRDDNNKILKEINLVPKEKVTYDKVIQKMTVTKFLVPDSLAVDTSPNMASKIVKVKNNDNKEVVDNSDHLDELTSWKDDALVFDNDSFEDIAIKMERWFGIPITIKDENLKQERFTGKFVNKESVYQILDIINRSEPIQYTRKNNVIIISRHK